MFGVKAIPYTGGIERTVEEIGSRLAQRGHEVIVYVRPHYVNNFQNKYRGMKLILTTGIHSKHLDAITHTTTATLDALFKGVDIFYYHSIGISVFSYIPRFIGSKTVVHIHGLDWQREKWGYFGKLYLKMTDYSAVYFPNLTIAVSKDNVRHYKQKFGREVLYLPNGAPVYKEVEANEISKYGINKDGYILFASRLVPEKGCHYLIEAYENISTDKKLVIAGDTSIHDSYYNSLLKKRGERIIFTGFVTGRLLQELFSNAYLFVQPSEIEGLPHSVLEALSFGKCVLASDTPGNLEALGDCGFTFRSKDAQDLKEKIEHLLANPNIVKGQREKVIEYVRRQYDWEKIVNDLEGLFYSLLRKGNE